MAPLIYLVTGAATGLGAALTSAILAKGDRVIATARSVAKLQHLKDQHSGPELSLLQLDVTTSQAELDAKVTEAIAIYGHIDVLVNNAGYTQTGTWEDLSHETILASFSTLVFGAVNLTRAILPHFRAAHAGTLIFTGSALAWYGYPGIGSYGTSKAALAGVVESLSQEVSPLGIKTICVEPGLFRSALLTPEKWQHAATKFEDYEQLMGGVDQWMKGLDGSQAGDPGKIAGVIVDAVHGTGVFEGKEVPLRLPLGSDALQMIRKKVEDELVLLREWEDVIVSTDITKT